MDLNLNTPLAFFDLETTGIDVATDRIVEISILRVEPDGDRRSVTKRIDPTIPIPEEASEIHGIFDIDVQGKPTFADVAAELEALLEGCDLAGFNSNRFDIPLLAEEFLRVGHDPKIEERRMVDVQTLFHKMERRDLSAAYKFYCGKELKDAHSAEADTAATFEILQAQIQKYEELENDMDLLHDLSKRNDKVIDLAGRLAMNDKGQEIFNFGKFKGRPVEEVLRDEPGYYQWMMKKDFPLYTKKVLKEIRDRIG